MGVRITDLPIASSSSDTDILPVVQEGTTKQMQKSTLFTDVNNSITEINTDLGELDDKIDEAIAEFTAPLTYKGEVTNVSDLPSGATQGDIYTVTSVNKNYIWNGTQWVEYSPTMDLSSLTNTIMTTPVAKSQEITDCAGVNGKLNIVDGDTYQATRDGNNMINEFSNQTLIIDNDGWITYSNTNTGSSTAYANLNFSPNTNLQLNKLYYFVLEVKSVSSSSATNTAITIASNNTGSNKGQFLTNRAYSFSQLQADDIQITNSTTRDSFDGCETFSRSYITIPAGATISITFRLSVVAQQPTAETFVYEPYGVSPSPDYPSDIRNVGDNVNLFDKTTVISNRAINYNNGNQSTADGFNASAFIKIKPNTKYTLDCVTYGSSSFGMAYYDSTKTYISGEKINTKVVTPSNAEYFRFGVNSNSDLDTVQLKETVENLPYTPYNCGSIDFKVRNKNLFAGWKRNQRVDPTTGAVTTSNNYLSSDFCNVKPNTNYYLSGVVTGNYSKNKFVSFYDINKNYISRSQSLNFSNLQFTTPTNAYYCIFCINGSFADSTTMENFISDCSEIQIEKGNTAISYVPHQEQNIQFSFAEGQLLHKGDYLADDGIHQNRKTIVLTGTETFTNRNILTNTTRVGIAVSPTAKQNSTENKCTHFENIVDYVLDKPHFYIGTTTLWLFVPIEIGSGETQIKQWLAEQYANGTPVTIEYELAEEIVTSYTTEQAEVYYQLQNLLLYKGYTTIECIDTMQPDIQVDYLYNNDINNYYGSRLDAIEARLRALEQS